MELRQWPARQDLIEYRVKRQVFCNKQSIPGDFWTYKVCCWGRWWRVENLIERNLCVGNGIMLFDSSEEAVICCTQTTLRGIFVYIIFRQIIWKWQHFPSRRSRPRGYEHQTGSKWSSTLEKYMSQLRHLKRLLYIFLHIQVSLPKGHLPKKSDLATSKEVYDPIWCLTEVTIRGNFILQDLVSFSTQWDEPPLQALQFYWSNLLVNLLLNYSVLLYQDVISTYLRRMWDA